LEAYFRENSPASIKEGQKEIEGLTEIKYSETQVREFLKKLHLHCQKVNMIPAKADLDEQAAYLEQVMEPYLAKRLKQWPALALTQGYEQGH
jgi:transposase